MAPFLNNSVGKAPGGRYCRLLNKKLSVFTGPKGEGGLDDATGQSGTKQQSMVINQGLGDTEERSTFDLDSMLKTMSLKGKADKAGKPEEQKEEGFGKVFKTLFGGKK